jgi:hypothetical protein
MDFLKRYPIFFSLLALCIVAFGVEVYFLTRFNKAARIAQSSLKSAEQTLRSTLALQPAPNQDNRNAVDDNVKALNAVLDQIRATLQDTPKQLLPPPGTGPELLVDIQQYVQQLDDLAKSKGIVLTDPNFAFGMGDYLGQTPPPVDKVPDVYNQMQVLQYVLGCLMNDAKLDNQKMMILAVNREDVITPPNKNQAAELMAAAAENGDQSTQEVFTIDNSARVPGAVNTLAFRIQFIGYSESLRILLDDLAKFELPLVVRGVEVEPPSQDLINKIMGTTASVNPNGGISLGGPSGASGSSKGSALVVHDPVIKDNLSQYTVTFEYIEMVQPKSEETAPAPGTAAPAAPAAGTATPAPAASATPATPAAPAAAPAS